MGVKLEVSAPIDMSAKKFWQIRNTQEYLNIECELLGMKTKEFTDGEYWDNGNLKSGKLRARPDLSHVPPSILRVVGNADPVFVDICNYPESGAYEYEYVSIPGIAQEYSDIKGKVWLTEEDDNTCVLHMCASISIKVRFLGVIVEQLVINGIRDGYAKLPQTIELYNERYPEITFEAGTSVGSEAKSTTLRRITTRSTINMRYDPFDNEPEPEWFEAVENLDGQSVLDATSSFSFANLNMVKAPGLGEGLKPMMPRSPGISSKSSSMPDVSSSPGQRRKKSSIIGNLLRSPFTSRTKLDKSPITTIANAEDSVRYVDTGDTDVRVETSTQTRTHETRETVNGVTKVTRVTIVTTETTTTTVTSRPNYASDSSQKLSSQQSTRF